MKHSTGTINSNQRRHVGGVYTLREPDVVRTVVVSEPASVVDESYVFNLEPDKIRNIEESDGNPPTRIGVELLSIVKQDQVVFEQNIYSSHKYASEEPITTVETKSFDR